MDQSLLKKVIAGRSVRADEKQTIRSLVLCNLSHKAALPLLRHEAARLGIYLDFLDIDYSDFLSFIQLNKQKIIDYKPELVFILFDEAYYLDPFYCCKSLEAVKQNIETLKESIYLLFNIFANNHMGNTRFIVGSLPYHKIYLNQYISLEDRNVIGDMISGFYKLLWEEHYKGSIQLDIVDFSEFRGKIIEDVYSDHNIVASLDFLDYFAVRAMKYIRMNYGKTIKCIITDLDNTLWDGVIIDDGVETCLKSDKKHLFHIYQKWLGKMHEQGIMISIASKNDGELIKGVFRDYPDELQIQWDIFSFPEINWEAKSRNIQKICNDLNISPEHVLFIDDNLYECEEVRHAIPELNIFHFTEDIEDNIRKLLIADYFIKRKITAEDKLRNETFSKNILRNQMKETARDNDDFLKKLHMQLYCIPYHDQYLERVSELSLKTNQFNMMTVRMSIKDVKEFIALPSNKILVFSCQDRLSEYGVIGLSFLSLTGKNCHVENMILSCRVFERQVEFCMMTAIFQYAVHAGCQSVTASFHETNKNRKFSNYYQQCGFVETDPGKFSVCLDTASLVDRHPYVELKELCNADE